MAGIWWCFLHEEKYFSSYNQGMLKVNTCTQKVNNVIRPW